MNWLSLILVLLIAAPLSPGVVACDMQQEQGAPVVQGQDVEPENDHDCCDGEPDPADEKGEHCDANAHCSGCFAGASAVPSVAVTDFATPASTVFVALPITSPPSHHLPPYRPPIA